MFISLSSGSIREHYTIGKMLGEGAFGQVMQVIPKVGGEPKAMKIINKKNIKKEDLEHMMEEV
jgi:serine/threonine protein kinase